MGYACPICGTVEADGPHLANHLAVTAMLHGDAHETWLDEHVADWADRNPDALGAEVVEHAEATDDELDVEEGGGHVHRGPEAFPADALDEEATRILAEARELTEQRQTDAAAEQDDR